MPWSHRWRRGPSKWSSKFAVDLLTLTCVQFSFTVRLRMHTHCLCYRNMSVRLPVSPSICLSNDKKVIEIANVNFLATTSYYDVVARKFTFANDRTRTTKYNRLVHKFRHRSTPLCLVIYIFTKFSEITQCNGHYAVQVHSRLPILVPIESSYTTSY